MTRIRYNPFKANTCEIGSKRTHDRDDRFANYSRNRFPLFSRTVYTPSYYPYHASYSPNFQPFYSENAQVFAIIAIALIGFAIYAASMDCIEQCTYDSRGIGICECISPWKEFLLSS